MNLEGQLRRQGPFGRIRRVHMVGIGGVGMSSIAEVLISRGFHVTGSDLKKSEVTDRLESLGALVFEKHSAEHVGDADVVVYSSAIRLDQNPETLEAVRSRTPLIPRAEMLGELMRMKFGIGVAGTHGKTTTTSMVGLVVSEGGFDPTIIVGGKVTVFGAGAVAGEGDIIVIEADEYDRTFLRLTPSVAVVTNIEAEHLDTYRDLEDIKRAFVQFSNSVPFFGASILCLDDPIVQQILDQVDRRVITYGISRQADLRAENIIRRGLETRFDVLAGSEVIMHLQIKAPGIHNVRNALAAATVGLELDIEPADIEGALARFDGVQRRFEIRGEIGGIMVVDDYAHHPSEIRATLEAAASGWPDRRIVAVFQPHLYSRTNDFKEDFARAFLDADVLVITDVYGAREQQIPGVTGQTISDLAARHGHRDVHYIQNKQQLPTAVLEFVGPDDLVIWMGAGDIWRYSRMFVESLQIKGGK